MCNHCDHTGDWIDSVQALARRHRATLVPAVGGLVMIAAVIYSLAYFFMPTDIQRAQTELQKAREIVVLLDEEADASLKDAGAHRIRAKEYAESSEEHRGSRDEQLSEWYRSMSYGHDQLSRANYERRDTLIRLTTRHLRLLAEAECEIIQAKNNQARGTPYPVARRVHDILAPILGSR